MYRCIGAYLFYAYSSLYLLIILSLIFIVLHDSGIVCCVICPLNVEIVVLRLLYRLNVFLFLGKGHYSMVNILTFLMVYHYSSVFHHLKGLP